MRFNEYAKNKLRKRNLENLEEVQVHALMHLEDGEELPGYLEDKIIKRCNEYGWTFYQTLASIITDPVAAAKFAKEAKKQGVAERAQQEFLEHRGIIVTKLVGEGSDAIRLLDGELVYGMRKGNLRSTKSMDFMCEGNDLMDLIYAKYTEIAGGAQDNQAQDVVRFLEYATQYVENHDDNIRFVALLDGGYYFDKLEDLKKAYASDRVLVVTSDTYYGTTTITTKSTRQRKLRDSVLNKELIKRVKQNINAMTHNKK